MSDRGNDTTLSLQYNAIACTCAQWSDAASMNDSTTNYYYLEPSNDTLIKADKLFDGNNLPLQIRVYGQIVSESGFPTGFNPAKGDPKPAKVFRYTTIEVIRNGE